ncbi:MAG: replicative DNA helicase [Mesorhizobium sp.]
MNAPYNSRDFRPALPDAIEAEQALLGEIIARNDTYWRVAGFLKATHFTEQLHRTLYETLGTMIAEGRAANIITIKSYLPWDQVMKTWDREDEKQIELTVGLYVVRMLREIPGGDAYGYGRAIIEVWSRRQLIAEFYDGIELALNMPVDMTPDKIIAATSDRLTQIAQEGNERAASLKYGVLLPKAIERVQKASEDASALIPWFLPEITTIAGDIRRGNLIGFMSDSGGGKTSFSLQQVRHAALSGYKAAFFSIEITEEEAALQAAAQASGISLGRLDAFTLNSKEWSSVEEEIGRSLDLPFDIVPFSDCTMSDIRIRIEAMKKSTGLDLVVIDHAKMIQLPGKSGDIFAERINALYRGLKAVAKSLNVAIVILIQRNDDWKARWKTGGSLRPMMGDAYGGSSVKQNLDVWFSLYRPEPLYKELIPQERRTEKRDELIAKYDQSRGKAWLINHKRRRGEPGTSQEIRFEAEFTRFSSSAADMPPAFEGFM